MRAIGNPIGNPVPGADGGQGARIGDIVFAPKTPNANFIPINRRRVYRDQYPRLADILQVYRENDGGEWLRPGDLFPPSTDTFASESKQVVCGGLSGGRNVLILKGNGNNRAPVVLRGDPNAKPPIFSQVSADTGMYSQQFAEGGISEKGTIIILDIIQDTQGNVGGQLIRSTDAMATRTASALAPAGLNGSATASYRPFVVPVGGDVWLIFSGDQVFRSDNDGRDWRLVNRLMLTGQNDSGSAIQQAMTVTGVLLSNGRIWLIHPNFTQNGGQGVNYALDALLYSDDLFASYGSLRIRDASMADAYSGAIGMLGANLVVLQWTRTSSERGTNSRTLPVRGFYIRDANPANGATFFEIGGTSGYMATSFNGHAVFSWDGIGYIGLSGLGLYQVTPRTLAKTKVSATASDGYFEQAFGPKALQVFPNMALVLGDNQESYSQRARSTLQAVPSAAARQYFQFNDAGVVGAQRADGKLPFMRAR